MSRTAWTQMFLPDELEKAVVACDDFKKRFGTLASFPYNREKPDQTIWWLFQKSKVTWGNWPAFSLGKFFFDRPRGRGVIRAGIHIEKGIAPECANKGYAAGKGKHFGMTPEWSWYGFVEDLRVGRVASALAEMARRSVETVEVELEPNYPLDQPVISEKLGYHRFAFREGGRLELINERARPDKLPGIGRVTSLNELGDRLQQATKIEPWTWINVLVGCAFPFHAKPPVDAGPAWNGSDFWENVLEPLAGWVK